MRKEGKIMKEVRWREKIIWALKHVCSRDDKSFGDKLERLIEHFDFITREALTSERWKKLYGTIERLNVATEYAEISNYLRRLLQRWRVQEIKRIVGKRRAA